MPSYGVWLLSAAGPRKVLTQGTDTGVSSLTLKAEVVPGGPSLL